MTKENLFIYMFFVNAKVFTAPVVWETAALVSPLKLSREKPRIETSTTKTLITLHLVLAHNPFRNVLAEYGNTYRAFSRILSAFFMGGAILVIRNWRHLWCSWSRQQQFDVMNCKTSRKFVYDFWRDMTWNFRNSPGWINKVLVKGQNVRISSVNCGVC